MIETGMTLTGTRKIETATAAVTAAIDEIVTAAAGPVNAAVDHDHCEQWLAVAQRLKRYHGCLQARG